MGENLQQYRRWESEQDARTDLSPNPFPLGKGRRAFGAAGLGPSSPSGRYLITLFPMQCLINIFELSDRRFPGIVGFDKLACVTGKVILELWIAQQMNELRGKF